MSAGHYCLFGLFAQPSTSLRSLSITEITSAGICSVAYGDVYYRETFKSIRVGQSTHIRHIHHNGVALMLMLEATLCVCYILLKYISSSVYSLIIQRK